MTVSEQHSKIRMDGNDRRELILDAAARLFAEFGFDHVTTKQLAKEAKCSEALLYRHFSSKDEIYDVLFEEFCRMQNDPPIIEYINDSAIESLKNLYETLVFSAGSLSNEKAYRPFLTKAVQNRPSYSEAVMEAVRQGSNMMEDAIIPMIELGKKQGEITSAKDARDIGRLFWIIMIGAWTVRNFNPSIWHIYDLQFKEFEGIFKENGI